MNVYRACKRKVVQRPTKSCSFCSYSTQAASKRLKLHCFLSRSTNPYFNLAIEDWLFRNTDPESYILYLWQNEPCVVIGRNQNPWKECNIQFLNSKNIPLIRRKSGGGTVYHDLGNSCYTFITPRSSFSRSLAAQLVTDALQALRIPAIVSPRFDITVNEKKCSGSAYKLVHSRAYAHGTMLIRSDLETLRNALKVDKPGLVSKGVGSVRSSVCNLVDFDPSITHQVFCNAVWKRVCQWSNNLSVADRDLDTGDVELQVVDDNNHHNHGTLNEQHDHIGPPTLQQTTQSLHQNETIVNTVKELQSWEWTYGQTPSFTNTFAHNFDHSSFGTVHVQFESNRGLITACTMKVSQPWSKMFEDCARTLVNRKYHPESIDEAFKDVMHVQEKLPVMEWIKQSL